MLRATARLRCMPVKQACALLGLRSPPTDKRQLKKRFLAETKKHHPDSNSGSAESTERMAQLTEAYALLKKLIDDGVRGRHHHHHHQRAGAAHSSSSSSSSSGGGYRYGPDMTVMGDDAKLAEEFVAPGSSLSLRGFSLPWQRARPAATAVASIEDELAASCGGAAAQQATARPDKRGANYSSKNGCHGAGGSRPMSFGEYYRRIREAERRGAGATTDNSASGPAAAAANNNNNNNNKSSTSNSSSNSDSSARAEGEHAASSEDSGDKDNNNSDSSSSSSEGSHGFTKEYFDNLHRTQEALRQTPTEAFLKWCGGGAGRLRRPTALLAARYASVRARLWVRHAPRRMWDACRYIIQG